MKAVYIKEFGGAEKLEIRDVPAPSAPHGDKVTVRVRAAGLNRADLLQRRGLYPAPEGFSSNIPGLEFAGEIAAAGAAATAFQAGDRVMGITAGEAQAEFVSTDASHLVRIPEGMSFTDAAAIPEAFITAHDAMITQAGLALGETVLVHAVASGVGLAALQIANAVGARAIGTSRTADKLDRCREFGLEHAVLSASGEFAAAVQGSTGGNGVDVILDLVGASYLAENLASLKTKGRMVFVGLTGGSKAEVDLGLVLRKRATLIGTVLRGRSAAEKADATQRFASDLLPLFSEGKLKAVVDRAFPFTDVIAAHEYLESNASFGKVVLEF